MRMSAPQCSREFWLRQTLSLFFWHCQVRSSSYFVAFRWVPSKVVSPCLWQAMRAVTQPQSQQCSKVGRNGLTLSAAAEGTRSSMASCRMDKKVLHWVFKYLSLNCCYSVGSLRVLWFTEMHVLMSKRLSKSSPYCWINMDSEGFLKPWKRSSSGNDIPQDMWKISTLRVWELLLIFSTAFLNNYLCS